MRNHETAIYKAMKAYAVYLHKLTTHFPKDLKYSYGMEIRREMMACMRCCSLANAEKSASKRLSYLGEFRQHLEMIDAAFFILEDDLKSIGGNPIGVNADTKVAVLGESVRRQLEGWINQTTVRIGA